MNKLNIIWKPTEGCNLACKYCYVGEAPKEITPVEKMQDGILKWAQYIGKEGMLDITMHGGEPMVCGSGYYQKLMPYIESLRSEGYRIDVGMQSNGTLFTDESLNYLLEHKVHLGLSLDGTEATNGRTRVYANGRNSYEKIISTIQKLKAKKGQVGVICVVSKANIDELAGMYEHLKGIGITSISFNPLFPSGTAEHNSCLHISGDEWNEKMAGFFNYWWNDENKLKGVRPFDGIIKAVLTGSDTICSSKETCQGSFISVRPNGDVHPCGRFREEETRYGNIFADAIDTIMQHPLRQELLCRAEKMDEGCKACNYRQICNGGCMHNAYKMSGNLMAKDPFCQKPLFEHIYQTLETKLSKELELLRKGAGGK